jgi:S1-C subfamily serine protease
VTVQVCAVIQSRPKEKADVQVGDILISIDDKVIESWRALLDTVSNLAPDKTVSCS